MVTQKGSIIMNTRTKKFKTLWILFAVISILLTFGPVGFFFVKGFIEGTILVRKVTLMMTGLVYILITLMAVINKHMIRSKVWIVLIALYFVIDSFAACVLTVGICQLVDEIIVSPLQKQFHSKYSTNKEIDKRG